MHHILLIEDDKDIRNILCTYFKKRDITIIEAKNGYEGISFMNDKVELVLLDIMMPGIDEYEVLIMKKNIKIEVNTIDHLLHADYNLIKTLLSNFLSNAIKHTFENGKIVITIDKGVSIFNEGYPIEENRLNGIWYTFVTHDQEGSGLGLAICRSILELHEFEYGVKIKKTE